MYLKYIFALEQGDVIKCYLNCLGTDHGKLYMYSMQKIYDLRLAVERWWMLGDAF